MRDRRGETLFIDARKLGTMIDRVHRELTGDEIKRLVDTYHAWRGEGNAETQDRKDAEKKTKGKKGRDQLLRDFASPGLCVGSSYADIPGFCKSATKDEIAEHGYVLTPGRYVGAEEVEDDDEPFEEKMQRLTSQLNERFAESAKLESAIRSNLKGLGYG